MTLREFGRSWVTPGTTPWTILLCTGFILCVWVFTQVVR